MVVGIVVVEDSRYRRTAAVAGILLHLGSGCGTLGLGSPTYWG